MGVNNILFRLYLRIKMIKLKSNIFVVVAFMFLELLPNDEISLNDITDNYISKTKKNCMRINTIRHGLSIISLLYWSMKKGSFLTSKDYEKYENTTVYEMKKFAKKYLVGNIPAAYQYANSRMYCNEITDPVEYTDENSYVEIIAIEKFYLSMIKCDLIYLNIYKEGKEVLVKCTYSKTYETLCAV